MAKQKPINWPDLLRRKRTQRQHLRDLHDEANAELWQLLEWEELDALLPA